MATLTFTVEGAVNVSVTVTENDDGTLTFDLAVLDETGSIGDLQGLFFDIGDDALVDGLSVSGDDVTDEKFSENSVSKLSGGVNVNGEVLNEAGHFDGGIRFGTSGIGKDDIRETSFTLAHDSADLTLDLFLSQDFAVRLTSVGAEGGARDDSLKLLTVSPDTIDDPDDPGDGGDPDGTSAATDDYLTVFNSNEDGFDFLDGGAASVLENDVNATGVSAVSGDESNVAQFVTGSDGGLLAIFADGTIDFKANGDFDWMGAADEAVTVFDYTTDAGDTANVIVTVFADQLPPMG